MARFTLKQLFLVVLVGAPLSMAVAQGMRGSPSGLAVIVGLVTAGASLVIFAVMASLLCVYAQLTMHRGEQPTSPFATDALPEQLIPPSEPDAT